MNKKITKIIDCLIISYVISFLSFIAFVIVSFMAFYNDSDTLIRVIMFWAKFFAVFGLIISIPLYFSDLK